MLPSRPPGPPATGLRKAGAAPQPMSFDAVKERLLAKLEDRVDLSASKRMPQSLLKQTIRQTADQLAEVEARGFAKPDRDRLVDAVLTEFLGYGPLEELFADPVVREIMLTGPGAVIVRRDSAQWLPTSVRFRDEAHVRATLDKMASHADPVGPVMASMAVFDAKLPNGFRAIALTPPDALQLPATAVFLRERTAPGSNPGMPGLPPGSKAPAAPAAPAPRGPGDTQPLDPLMRHRNRILERLLTKFASMGLYDVSRLDPTELQRIVAAYVTEYATAEKVYLSDTDHGRLTLEVLTALRG